MPIIRRLQPIEIAAGNDASITIPLYDATNANLSVTGKTAQWKLFRGVPHRGRKPFTGSAVLIKTSAAGQIALSDGLATVTVEDTDLTEKSGDFWQVIEITTTATGAVSTHGQGRVRLRAGA